MDTDTFDRLTRTWGSLSTRRASLSLALCAALVLAWAALPPIARWHPTCTIASRQATAAHDDSVESPGKRRNL